jgi:hypothetical protein
MSDSDADNRSAASAKSGSFPRNKKLSQQQPVSRVQIGIEELKGYYYVYGRPDQAQMFRKTSTEKIADYVAQNYKSGKEMYRLVTYGIETTYKDPGEDPGNDATPAQVKAHGLLFTSAREDRLQYHNDKFKTFRLIMGQCSPTMKQRIQATPEYKIWEDPEQCNVKALLPYMEALVSGTEKGQYQPWVIQAQLKKLLKTRQTPGMSLDEYAQNFEDQLAVVKKEWGKLVPYKYQEEDAATQEEEGDKFKACLLLGNADRERYKEVIDELANDYSLGNDNYPKDAASMVAMLSNQHGTGSSTKKIDAMKDGVFTSFGQADYSDARCSICKKKGHFARNCPEKKKKKQKDKGDGLKGATSLLKTQGNPWANKDSNCRSNSSGPKGWFR